MGHSGDHAPAHGAHGAEVCQAKMHRVRMQYSLMTVYWSCTPTLPALQELTFKFWPELSDQKAWERRLHMASSLCCCSRRLHHKSEEDGGPVPLARMGLVFASVSIPSWYHSVQHVEHSVLSILPGVLDSMTPFIYFRVSRGPSFATPVLAADVWLCGHDDFRLPGGLPAGGAAAAVPPQDRPPGAVLLQPSLRCKVSMQLSSSSQKAISGAMADLSSMVSGSQHMAEDADLLAAEDGQVPACGSSAASFDDADPQRSTFRQPLTSAGIADAEGGWHMLGAVP